jgi:hypothetical protein
MAGVPLLFSWMALACDALELGACGRDLGDPDSVVWTTFVDSRMDWRAAGLMLPSWGPGSLAERCEIPCLALELSEEMSLSEYEVGSSEVLR